MTDANNVTHLDIKRPDPALAERTRCSAIIKAAIDNQHAELGKKLAFETSLSAPEAVAIIEAAAKGSNANSSGAQNSRHAARHVPDVGA